MILTRLKIILLILVSTLFVVGSVCAQPPQISEYQVKAAFLFNFAKFVDWPTCKGCKASDRLYVGILGEDPFGEAIDTIEGKKVEDKTLHVIHADKLEELKGADVIFISAAQKTQLPLILKQLEGRPVLTVSDTIGFAHQGVMINLIKVENKIRFEVNISAAAKAELKISSQLLRLAKIIENTDRPGN